jgi:hypothetical protein
MYTPLNIDEAAGPSFESTGHLPPARTPRELFGLCVVETNGVGPRSP